MNQNFKIIAHAGKMQQEDRAKDEKRVSEVWRTASLQSRMLHLRQSGLLFDCQFLVGTKWCTDKRLFLCHKIILCSASEVFESMLYGQFAEASTSEPIKIDDVTPEDFEIFLKFVYGDLDDNGTVRPLGLMKWTALKSLLQLGNKYMVNGFVERLADWVSKLSLTIEETLDFFEFRFDIDNHILNGTKYKDRLDQMIYGTEWLQNGRLYSMSIEAFTELIHFTSKRQTTMTKYNVITEYVKRLRPYEDQPEEAPPNEELKADNSNVDTTFPQYKRDVLKLLLQSINYYDLTPKEFVSGPCTLDILSVSEKYKILTDLVMGHLEAKRHDRATWSPASAQCYPPLN